MIALFLTMGGVSYGLAGSNSVTKDDLRANSVGKSEIRTGAGGKSELGRGSVGTNEAPEDTDRGGGFTGAQIKEDTLGKVPNADKLDDLDSSAFVKGAGGGQRHDRGRQRDRRPHPHAGRRRDARCRQLR